MSPITKKIQCDGCHYSLPVSKAKMCQCKKAIYCGENCQILHWKLHKIECFGYKNFFSCYEPLVIDLAEELENDNFFEPVIDLSNFQKKNLNSGDDCTSRDNENQTNRDTKRDTENFVLNFKDYNDYLRKKGVKKLLLKYKYDEQTLQTFSSINKSWEIKNLDIIPLDGTLMLLARSEFKCEDFLSVTFYIDLDPASSLITEAKIKTRIATKKNSIDYEACYEKKELLHQRKKKLHEEFSVCMERFLERGVRVVNFYKEHVNGLYHFAGHSNSQLRNTSCYLIKATPEEIYRTLITIGKFDLFSDLIKLVKRIGLLFTTVKSPVLLFRNDWEVENDIESPDKRYCFTDGCGRISTALMRVIMTEMGFSSHERTISAVQIRFKGFKGMLVHDPKVEKIKFTRSMQKFEDVSVFSPIGVCNWSRPFMPGYLILHYVLLLSTLGIPDHVFEKKQEIYNEQLKKLMTDPFEAYHFTKNRAPHIAKSFIREGLTRNVITALRSLKRDELTKFTRSERNGIKFRSREEIERVRIYVPKSRNVHGVRDTVGALNYGQVFFCPTRSEGSSKPLRGRVVVVRTPCYYPGDVRILCCVDPGSAYAHLFDVLVFPTQGQRPHADEMSGGDLDGDIFWVCWDPELIPNSMQRPFEYFNEVKENLLKNDSSEAQQRIAFFSQHDPNLLGIIDTLFFEYADRFKANCAECHELNKIFTQVVDNNTTDAKEKVQQLRAKLRLLPDQPKNFIWRRIEQKNKELRAELSPNFGVVRKAAGRFKDHNGRKWAFEIHSTDFDEPVFPRYDSRYIGVLEDGDYVRFFSEWDSYLNRYLAMNIVKEPNMNFSHLVQNLTLPLCTGKVKTLYIQAGEESLPEDPLGCIVFKAQYMKHIVNNLGEDEVPFCEVEFNKHSINEPNFFLDNLKHGSVVRFNLAYDHKGNMLAMDLEIIDEHVQETNKQENRNVQVGMTSNLNQKIFYLVQKFDNITEDEFLRLYYLEYLTKLNATKHGFKSVTEIVSKVDGLKVFFDAAGEAHFERKGNKKKEIETPKLEELRNFSLAENWESDDEKGSDENVYEFECYYCGKDDHIPFDCEKRFEEDSEFNGDRSD